MAARIPTMTFVFFGIGTSLISRPSNPLIEVESGRTTSCRVLRIFFTTAPVLDNVYKDKITRTEKSKRTSSLTKKEADNYEMEFFFRDRAGTERKTITLTASKFHGRPHPDMVN